jgi:hypothetical protein
MKQRRHSDIIQQLSMYIDGALDEQARRDIEQLLEHDEEVRHLHAALIRNVHSLRQAPKLKQNSFLAEKTFNVLRKRNEKADKELSIPRKYLPAFAGLVALTLIAVGVFTWWQGGSGIVRYVEHTSEQMQRMYEESILKGWIMPLFRRTDNDQVLTFAMFGTLPLDSAETTVLRIDPATDNGYRVELAGTTHQLQQRSSIEELYERLQPTNDQRRNFDTLFSNARMQIEAAVLLDSHAHIAIDPELPRLQKVLLSSIASQLNEDQQQRFRQFLGDNNASYTLAAAVPQRPPTATATHWRHPHASSSSYVLITADSVGITDLKLNLDSLRALMTVVESRLPHVEEIMLQRARQYADQAQKHSRTRVGRDDEAKRGRGRVRVIVNEAPSPATLSLMLQELDREIADEIHRELENISREFIIPRMESGLTEKRTRDALRKVKENEIRIRVKGLPSKDVRHRADSALRHAMEELQQMQMSMDSLGLRYTKPGFEQDNTPNMRFLYPIDSLLQMFGPDVDSLRRAIKKQILKGPPIKPERRPLPPPEIIHPRTRRDTPHTPPTEIPRMRSVNDTVFDI